MSTSIRILARSVAAVFFLVGAGGSASLFGQVVTNPTSINYGNVSLGLQTSRALVLTNKGTSSVQVESMTFPFSQEYGIADGVFPITLNANGGVTTYSVIFRPSQAIPYNGNITINFNSLSPLTVPVTGSGAIALGGASLSLKSVPYGNVTLGSTVSQQVTITNVGTAAFSVTQIITYAPFSISGFANSKVTVQPGKSLTFTIGFSPFNPGPVNGTTTIFYDSLPAQGIDMTGTGVSPTRLAITSYPTLPSATQTFPYAATLQATGGTPPYSWQITSGSVKGLTFSTTTGTFGGTVSGSVTKGMYNIGMEVRDSSTPALKVQTIITIPVGAPTSANCGIISIDIAGTQTPVTAINDLGTGSYEGEEGGLYPSGSNVNPQQAAGVSIAQALVPLDANGAPDPTNGLIGMISIGESATQQPFSQFIPIANADPTKNPKVVFVNGALGGETAGRLVVANNGYIGTMLNYLLPFAGVTPQQVEVAWVDAIDSAQSGFPGDAQLLQGELETLAQSLKTTFPNLALAYFGSLNYTGYSQGVSTINPEPDAYETGFGDKWAIQDQINGNANLNYNPANGPVLAPWMGWGDYYWANGLLPRTDGTYWSCQDLGKDGVHPTYPGGQLKIAESLLTFLKSDTTATPWFVVAAH
jgi:hypothetical protein